MKLFKTINKIAGPLIFLEKVDHVGYGEIVEIILDDEKRTGKVLEVNEEFIIVQVFEDTISLNLDSKVRFLGESLRVPVSSDMLGRIFSGSGKPIDGMPDIVGEEKLDINGLAINPCSRQIPSDFIQTGISAIDCMNTLVRGQKLPIFSVSGLPHNKLALQISRQAKLKNDEKFAVIFAGIGITHEEASYFIRDFERTGALENAVIFLNLANDPSIERLITPRLALTVAEYLAFEHGMHILTIITDMTNYCEALREISAAKGEIPGRRGYPGYIYTDLATIYERAGRLKSSNGTITQIPILTMPENDKTHPIPDLTGYITEGQIVLDKGLQKENIYPPIDVLPSLSRLMNNGIGPKKTREDHKYVSNQLYSAYAKGVELRNLSSIIGEDALSQNDKLYLDFAKNFEFKFLKQGEYEDRDIEESLDLAWELLSVFDKSELKRIKPKFIEKYYKRRDI